jgi:hypothetical protein
MDYKVKFFLEGVQAKEALVPLLGHLPSPFSMIYLPVVPALCNFIFMQ